MSDARARAREALEKALEEADQENGFREGEGRKPFVDLDVRIEDLRALLAESEPSWDESGNNG